MKEYATEAIVLDKEPQGELDSRVFLFTEALGKISAKVKSGRRITSKLSPHLEPLDVSKIRLIEKGGFQIADAMKIGRLPANQFKTLIILKDLVLDGHADYRLWSLLKSGTASAYSILSLLGFDPIFAQCEACGAEKPKFFFAKESFYYCENCLPPYVKATALINYA